MEEGLHLVMLLTTLVVIREAVDETLRALRHKHNLTITVLTVEKIVIAVEITQPGVPAMSAAGTIIKDQRRRLHRRRCRLPMAKSIIRVGGRRNVK